MSQWVVVREDDSALADLVRELLEEAGYNVAVVTEVDDLLRESALRSPCVALVDSMNQGGFDLWHLGPILVAMGVPAVAFTAHASARTEFAKDPHGYLGVVSKPFEADDFVGLVNEICSEEDSRTGS